MPETNDSNKNQVPPILSYIMSSMFFNNVLSLKMKFYACLRLVEVDGSSHSGIKNNI